MATSEANGASNATSPSAVVKPVQRTRSTRTALVGVENQPSLVSRGGNRERGGEGGPKQTTRATRAASTQEASRAESAAAVREEKEKEDRKKKAVATKTTRTRTVATRVPKTTTTGQNRLLQPNDASTNCRTSTRQTTTASALPDADISVTDTATLTHLMGRISLEEEEKEMGSLTEQQEQKVEAALSRGKGGEVLSVKFNISIKRDDVRTLAGLNWLNDEVINFYMNLIVERGKQEGSPCRVHAMSSFFYPKLCEVGYSGVCRWTKKVDIFSIDLLLYPINLGSHWCLAAIHTTRKTLSYYDSLGGGGRSCLETLRQYLVSEHRDKRKTELSLEGWRDNDHGDIHLQKNSSDCGVFICMYARHLASNTAFTFSQEHMPDIRRHLLEQRILL